MKFIEKIFENANIFQKKQKRSILDKSEEFLVEIKGDLLGYLVEGKYSNLKINLTQEEKLN